jgi:hypothetical protein
LPGADDLILTPEVGEKENKNLSIYTFFLE